MTLPWRTVPVMTVPLPFKEKQWSTNITLFLLVELRLIWAEFSKIAFTIWV